LALQEQAYAIGKLDLDAVESTVLSSIRKGGEPSEHNSHKRHKGVKIHVAVSPSGLTLSIVVCLGKVLGYFHPFLSKCHRTFLRTQARTCKLYIAPYTIPQIGLNPLLAKPSFHILYEW
jgi:hypothetical protein